MTPRVRELCGWLREYAETRLHSQLMDDRRSLAPYVVMDLGNRGLLGACATRGYGGSELATPEILAVFEQLGAIDLTLAIFLGIHNALGVRPIQQFGGEALRAELLPQLAAGRILGALAMTEPGAGSNARGIETMAHAAGDGWRLRGTKIWVGNGSWAGAINVFARRPPDDGGGMSAFTVRPGAPGLRMGPEALTTGMRAIVQNTIHLDDVAVTRADLLYAPGEGFAVAEDSFGLARIGISAIALGGLRRCAQLALRYASRRRIATGALLANAHTREVLGGLVASVDAAAALLRTTGAACDATGAPPAHLAAICKIVVPELLWLGVDRTVQLLGGRGYIETNELPRLMRDARLLRIFEGPTETLAMHLGAAVLANMPGILELVGTPAVRAHVDAWIARLSAPLAGTRGDDRVVAGQRAKRAIGEVVAWGVLAAGADDLAARWTLAQLDARATAALAAAGDREPGDIARAIAGYREVIGDIEQQLPGTDGMLDPLLRREAP